MCTSSSLESHCSVTQKHCNLSLWTFPSHAHRSYCFQKFSSVATYSTVAIQRSVQTFVHWQLLWSLKKKTDNAGNSRSGCNNGKRNRVNNQKPFLSISITWSVLWYLPMLHVSCCSVNYFINVFLVCWQKHLSTKVMGKSLLRKMFFSAETVI